MIFLQRFSIPAIHLALIAAGASAPAAEPFPVAPGIVELPTYTVTETRDLPPPERWSYAQIDGFEILSNASERATRDLVRHFQRFAQALDIVWPGARRPAEVPTALIVCGRGGKFDEFVPAGAESKFDRGKISLTLRTREQSAIIVDYEAKVIDLAVGGQPVKEIEVDAHQQLSREYIRFVFGGDQSPFPPWFVEGIAQILMSMEVSKTLITVGRVEDPNLLQIPTADPSAAQEWDRSFNGALKNRALLPMGELLGMAADAPEALNPISGTWAKQSAAFVHWGIYGNGGRDQKAFLQFVTRAMREPVSEQLFQDCFKRTYKQMLDELVSYVDFTAYQLKEFRARKGEKLPDVPPLELRAATEAEIGRLKGDALRLAGHHAAARATMAAAYMRGERDAQLLAALGLQERAVGDPARARKLLEAAVEAKAVRPRAYVELALMRFNEANAAAPAGGWSPTQVNAIVAPLLVARNQPPPSPELYELMTATWLRAGAAPGIEQLKIADEAVRRFPRNLNLIYDAALLMQRAGRVADAAMIVRHGLSVARTDEDRARFTQLQAALAQP